ncbi:hypothetical protein [Nostoc sp. UHCC 0252]|uniref:hypothetical protein n=1 Tax=Nostoc sp. UHCC 0252 TaxID=3110241 RepID=UPI002B21621B|nr:hypothetical protein [Nostoc sp. UHCC 0252]MEA5604825.1 hypothetical protein [Nostoc sp. UHCC 0252]
MDIHESIDNTLMILQHRLKATDKIPAILFIRNYGNLFHIQIPIQHQFQKII